MTQNIKNIPFDIDVADERLRPLCEMYWEIDSTGEFAHSLEEIAEKFNIPPLEIHNLVRTLSRAWKSGVVCIKCKENGPFYSRYEYDRAPLQNFICFDCEQEFNPSDISLDKKDAFKKFQEISMNKYHQASYLNPSQISLKQSIFLLALLRYSGNEDLTAIKPIAKHQNVNLFSPHLNYDRHIVKTLYKEGIILMSPDTPYSSFNNSQSGFLDGLYWEVLLPPGVSLFHLMSKIEEKLRVFDYEKVEGVDNELMSICHDISYYECVSYLEYLTDEHSLTIKIGEKTKRVIFNALDIYSVSQIYSFIYRGTKSAASFYLQNKVSKTHAANTIVGNIERSIERSVAEDWNVKGFGRNFNIPQSILCEVVYNFILKKHDAGFNLNFVEICQIINNLPEQY